MDLNSSGSSFDIGEGSSSESPISTPRKKKGRGRGRKRSISPIKPLSDPHIGQIVWAKFRNSRHWPAILLNKEDCDKLATAGKGRSHFVYWYGDGRVSPIAQSKLFSFKEGFLKFTTPEGSKNFRTGVYLAITDLRRHYIFECGSDNWNISTAFEWARSGFPLPEGCEIQETDGTIPQNILQKLAILKQNYEEIDDSDNETDTADASLHLDFTKEQVDLILSVRNCIISIKEICLACISKISGSGEHPLFHGGLCEICLKKFLERSFYIGVDAAAYCCSVCMNLGDMMICGRPYCYRAYCTKCIVLKATPDILTTIREADPWICFLCAPFTSEMHGLLKPCHEHWKKNMWQMFHTKALKSLDPLHVLCLDHSVDAALSLLSSNNLQVDKLYLCNFTKEEEEKLRPLMPKNVSQLASMEQYEDLEALSTIAPIHLVIASSSETDNESFAEYFFSFYNILSLVEMCNQISMQPSVSVMWLLEVQRPPWHEFYIMISRYLEFDPGAWSSLRNQKESSLVWTNFSPFWSQLGEQKMPRVSKRLRKL